MNDLFERRLSGLKALEPSHSDLRTRFGLAEQDETTLRRVASLYDLPAWAQAGISLGDALFLYDIVRATKPARVVELGVAAGCSSALLLGALADAHAGSLPPSPLLLSADLHSECFFDRSRRVGAAVHEMTPQFAHQWRLHTGATARDLPHLLSLVRSRPIHLAFIDADHRHPSPIEDLAAMLPCLAPGAWVVLHDISLPEMAVLHEAKTGQKVDWNETGPKLLYEHWPFEKVRGERCGDRPGSRNIGAVRLPPQRLHTAELVELLGPALSERWQTEPSDGYRRLLDSARNAA